MVDVFFICWTKLKQYDSVFLGFFFKYKREGNEKKHNSFIKMGENYEDSKYDYTLC
jgi:hypothetical protein